MNRGRRDSPNYEKQFPYTLNVRAVRTDRWKYIRYPRHFDGMGLICRLPWSRNVMATAPVAGSEW
jgi:hypothetical protein